MQKIVFEQMVAGLAKPGAEILESLTPEKAHLMHMAVGVAGESAELLGAFVKEVVEGVPLDLENVTEEIGDAEFYLEGLRQGLGYERIAPKGLTYVGLGTPSLFKLASIAMVTAGDILDSVKKGVIYNKPFDHLVLKAQLLRLDEYLRELCIGVGVSREVTLEANISKLGKRYEGHKYSDEAAQNRADKNEN